MTLQTSLSETTGLVVSDGTRRVFCGTKEPREESRSSALHVQVHCVPVGYA